MTNIAIYHNPRCSKSRQTLQLLQKNGIEPTIIEYLKDTPSAEELTMLLTKLGVSARDIIRTKEEEYKRLNLKQVEDEQQLIEAMVAHPKLIERPIVAKGNQAVMGRPPENVMQLL